MSKLSPIAIIGMGGRFPGSATDPQKLWNMCAAEEDGWSETPPSRYTADGFYHPDQSRHGSTNVKGAFYLNEDLARFDAPFFGMTKAEAATLDPQQRLILECTYEALENAGITLDEANGSDMGVFVGSFCSDWAHMMQSDPDAVPLYTSTGSGQSLLANRVSYVFNMHGPSVQMDTACSSSLIALHTAVNAIRAGDCSTAIVAGVNCLLSQDAMAEMSFMGFLSKDGRSYTYDARANGYGRGEGVGVVVIQSVETAIKNNRVPRAIIRHTGANQDGRTPGITHPSGSSQAALIRHVYRQAGLDLADTSYIEAHGTGTQTGDPIEAGALAETFGAARRAAGLPKLPVGSIKTNIGHLEGAAGVAGLIKTVLMLERETILPNFGFSTPNSKIPLDDWHLAVPTQLRPWRTHEPTSALRASVNSFGFGGANAHAIVESARDYLANSPVLSSPFSSPEVENDSFSGDDTSSNQLTPSLSTLSDSSQEKSTGQHFAATLPAPQLFALCAADEVSAKAQASQLIAYLTKAEAEAEEDSTRLFKDLAYTLSHRTLYPWRTVVSAASPADLRTALAAGVPTRAHGSKSQSERRVGFVFTGQGAQWWAMGRSLARTSASFRASLTKSAAILAAEPLCAPWDLEHELLGCTEAESRVLDPCVGQPLCTALQIALVDMLTAWGVSPSAVVGHSSGEMAAAYSAGRLSHAATLAAAYWRVAAHTSSNAGGMGGMIVLVASETETTALIESLPEASGQAGIACHNSPSSYTVSGDVAAIDELVSLCNERGIRNRRLPVTMAYHSPLMGGAAAGYKPLLEKHADMLTVPADADAQGVAIFSSVTGSQMEAGSISPTYWVDNLVQPVLFTQALTAMCALEKETEPRINVVIEIGPHGALAGPIRQVFQATSSLAGKVGILSMLTRNMDATDTAHAMAAALFCRGGAVDLAAINRDIQTSPEWITHPKHQASTVPRLLVDLPSYPWNHEKSYWGEPRESLRYRLRTHGRHDLLGAPGRFGHPLAPRWRQYLRVSELPWLKDHRIQGLVVFPAAAYLSMAIEAVHQVETSKQREEGAEATNAKRRILGYDLRDVRLGQALIVPDSGEVETHTSLLPADTLLDSTASTVWHDFKVFSCTGTSHSFNGLMASQLSETWAEHCRGQVSVRWGAPSTDDTHLASSDESLHESLLSKEDTAYRDLTGQVCSTSVDLDQMYKHCTEIGIDYGPTFANLTNVRVGRTKPGPDTPADRSGPVTHHLVGTVCTPDVAASMPAGHHSSMVPFPGTLDACLHGITAFGDLVSAAIMPVHFARIYIADALRNATTGDILTVFQACRRRGFRNLEVDLVAYGKDSQNEPLLRMGGLQVTSLAGSTSTAPVTLSNPAALHPHKTYYTSDWRPDPALLTDQQWTDLTSHLHTPEADAALLFQLSQAMFYMIDSALAQIPEDRRLGLSTKGQKMYRALAKQRDAVLAEAATVSGDGASLSPTATNIASWPSATPDERAAVLAAAIEASPAEGGLLRVATVAMHRIILGETDALVEALRDDSGLLARYYTENPRMARQYQQAGVIADLLANKNPQMRILEIGAGTGSATLPILKALGCYGGVNVTSNTDEDHVPRFEQYDITDISTGFLDAVRVRVSEEIGDQVLPRLSFRRLDITEDVSDAAAGKYDLVIAANVLHATPSLAATVKNVHRYLKPGGQLMLLELEREPGPLVPTMSTLFSIFDGWWSAAPTEPAYRQEWPLLTEKQWHSLLRENGFSGVDTSVWETADAASHEGSILMSTADVDRRVLFPSTSTLIFGTDSTANIPWMEQLASTVSETSSIKVCTMEQLDAEAAHAPDDYILVFFQTEPGTVGHQTDASLDRLRRLFLRRGGAGANVAWLTRGTLSGHAAPDLSLVKGLVRTLHIELGGRLVLLDLDESTDDEEAELNAIRRVLLRSFATKTHANDVELELSVTSSGMVNILRYAEHANSADDVAARAGNRRLIAAPVTRDASRPLHLRIGQPGRLDSLYWDDVPESQQESGLLDDHVDVSIHASRLHAHDVSLAAGDAEDITQPLGMEAAGVVTAVGSSATGLKPGDRVVTLGGGTLATTIRCPSRRVQAIPSIIDMQTAAGLPVALTSAMYALHIANLDSTEAETVLVHAAANALTDAILLLHLCEHRGVNVLTTAESSAHREMLMAHTSLDASRILLHNPSPPAAPDSLANEVLLATKGHGVDVVLCLTDPAKAAGVWRRCLAPLGRFIMIGDSKASKGPGSGGAGTPSRFLDMSTFDSGASFTVIDVHPILSTKPAYAGRLFSEGMALVRSGIVRPASIGATVFDMGDAGPALRALQSDSTASNVILSLSPTGSNTKPMARVTMPRAAPVSLRPDGTYILVGGLGGIGRALADRMVHKLGARHLVLISRRGIAGVSPEALAGIAELRKTARIRVVACDVSEAAQLKSVLHGLQKRPTASGIKEEGGDGTYSQFPFPPVRGIVHLGLVIENMMFQHVDAGSWNRSIASKVAGTWNLHHQLDGEAGGEKLDFFVLLSSLVGVLGNASQTAYGAASTFLDAFSQYRRRRGLEGTTIDLGMITGIGYVAENGKVEDTMRSQGFEAIGKHECLSLIESALGGHLVETGEKSANIVTGMGLGRYMGGNVQSNLYVEPRFIHCRSLASAANGDAQGRREAEGEEPGAGLDKTNTSIRARLRAAESFAQVADVIEPALHAKIATLLMLPPGDAAAAQADRNRPLSRYGLDSLVAVELRNWVGSEMDVTVPVLEFLGARTVPSLAGFIARQSRLVRKELLPEDE
ncbi:polyketide synthase [Ophiostoma piceae UAMH 11346]|uniref:Polyketide synthase n=1 Tax=Ophiostoma piceae (strain UAMH 11346) TaxID=1262450 RepID=S3BQG8_OPHP1|nr:polyketide synthase [Ophiostoma piceae UAMH 11346]